VTPFINIKCGDVAGEVAP